MVHLKRMTKVRKFRLILPILVFVVMKVICAENKTSVKKNNKTLIINLTTKSFDQEVKKAPHFVMFYIPRYIILFMMLYILFALHSRKN